MGKKKIGEQWIPLMKGQWQTVEQAVESPVIWDIINTHVTSL